MPVGFRTTIGQSSDFTVTRDELIEMALESIGVLPPGETMTAEMRQTGIKRLNLIVREVDESRKFIWTIQEAAHLTLLDGVGVYDANTGLSQTISEIISVVYRDNRGMDTAPLAILKPEAYECLTNKLESGTPTAVYLTDHQDIAHRRLYVHPIPEQVTVQSHVMGTDNESYKCIYPHTASPVTRPTTGPNWRMAWEVGHGAPLPWLNGAQYTMGESLRMVNRRPLFDFTDEGNRPDFPVQFPRLLLYRLSSDLADVYAIPIEERTLIMDKVKGAYADIANSLRPKTNQIHNKVSYF